MNRQERVTQRRDRERKREGGRQRERERENLYTFVSILKWFYVRIFFNAETSLNEASFSWCNDEL